MNDEMLAALGGVETVPFAGRQQPAYVGAGTQRMLDPTKNIELICENIIQSGSLPSADCLRIGLIAYRSYVTKSFAFTSSVPTMKEQLKGLYASGGGDGPEAVTAGIKAAMELDWRPEATKMCVLIADAPCHGLGEYGDGFPQGGPDGEDPLILAREMASKGVPLFVVACEPALSGYQFGLDWFRALTILTSGMLVPLTTATLLSHVIVGSALEHLEMERLIQEVGAAVAERIHAGLQTVDDVAKELHERLLLRGETTSQLKFEGIHRETDETRHNVEVLVNAPDLQTAKPQLQKVRGSRFTEKYLQSRYNSSFMRSTPSSEVLYPTLPPRPGSSTPSSTSGRGTPGSPPRKVISDFKPFSASAGLSVQDAPLQEHWGGAGANAPSAMGDEEVDKLASAIDLQMAALSFEQVRGRVPSASGGKDETGWVDGEVC
ncbi:hypothetical protein JCM10213v2_008480 [Rhodosporidiobolus nylandii]